MPAKFPDYNSAIGWSFYLLGLAAKANLPAAIGSSPFLQLPCAFFSAVFIPLGAFLALRAVIHQSPRRRILLAQFFIGLGMLFILLATYFYSYFILSRVLELPNSLPDVLPKLIANAKSLNTQDQRQRQAFYAYRLYGSVISYRRDDNQLVSYQPSSEDAAYRANMEKSDAKNRQLEHVIRATLNQYPYLFGLYLGTFSCTFLLGGSWLIWRCPRELPSPGLDVP